MVSSINSSGPVQPPITQAQQNKQAEETATATGQKATSVIQPKTAIPATEKGSLPQELLSSEVKKTLQSASQEKSSSSASTETSDSGPAPGEVDSDSESSSATAASDSGPAPGEVDGSEEASSSKAAAYDSRDTNKDGKVSTNELLTASAKKKEADAG